MAQRRRKKSPQKSLVLPGQLALFDTLEEPGNRAPAQAKRMQRARRAKPARATAAQAERPVVLSASEAAQYLGVSISTLKLWRARQIGPKWTKRGARLIGYRPAELERFLDANSKNG